MGHYLQLALKAKAEKPKPAKSAVSQPSLPKLTEAIALDHGIADHAEPWWMIAVRHREETTHQTVVAVTPHVLRDDNYTGQLNQHRLDCRDDETNELTY